MYNISLHGNLQRFRCSFLGKSLNLYVNSWCSTGVGFITQRSQKGTTVPGRLTTGFGGFDWFWIGIIVTGLQFECPA